ncbi:MAG TPA: hypothetical protein PKY29_10290 [Ferruginibacter sp.]|nr:hypothetical protein [Ferruginibacter sp.]HRO18472.1 hypothetical protein [Ferruginibacter sp.]HRQ21696.1 hypothetical protein [Ferruginibacter sp.]
MNFQTMNKQRKWMLIAAAVGVISMFLPWIKVSFLGMGSSQNGMHGNGIVVFICFLAGGLIAFLGNQEKSLDQSKWMLAIVASALAALLMIINYFRITDNPFTSGMISFGFYLALIAALALLVVTIIFRDKSHNFKEGLNEWKEKIEDKTKGNP